MDQAHYCAEAFSLITGVAPPPWPARPQGGDLRAGVRTLPVLYLLRRGGPDADKLAAVLDGDHDNGAVGDALDLLRRSPALAEARHTAQAEVDAARAALEGVPAGPVRTALGQVADQVLDRQV